MNSKGLSVVPNGIARLLGSTLGGLTKEFKYLSPSARRPAAPAPVKKPTVVEALMAVPATAAPVVREEPVIARFVEPAPVRRVEPPPVVAVVQPVAPVVPVARPPVEENRALTVSPVMQEKGAGGPLVLKGIEFESKAEQVRAEIYFRDVQSSNKALRMDALREIKNLSRSTMLAGLQQILAGERDALQIIELLNALAATVVDSQILKPLFIDYSKHADAGVRLAALRALSRYADEESFGILTSHLKDKDPEVRRQMLNCLCWTFSERALPFALKGLHDSDAGVRKAACQIVGTLKSQLGISALISLLSDSSEEVQESASAALKKITKQDFDFKVSASKKAKDDAIEGWRYWWRDNQTKFERVKK